MEALVTALLVWLSAHGPWEVPDSRPEIVVENQRVIQNMSGYDDGIQARALYDDKSDRIWIAHDVDLKSVSGKTTLVHELVHYLQDIDPQHDYMCDREKELPAYKYGEQYSLMQGVDPNINWLFVASQFRCPPPFVDPTNR